MFIFTTAHTHTHFEQARRDNGPCVVETINRWESFQSPRMTGWVTTCELEARLRPADGSNTPAPAACFLKDRKHFVLRDLTRRSYTLFQNKRNTCCRFDGLQASLMTGKLRLISHIAALFSTDPIIRSFCVVRRSSRFQVTDCRDTSPGLRGSRDNDSLARAAKVSGRDGWMSRQCRRL